MATPIQLTDDDRKKLRTGMIPEQKTLDTAPKAPVGQAPPLELPTGAVARRSYAANTDPTPFVPTRENLGGGGGFSGARMSQADVDAQVRQPPPSKVTFPAPSRPVESSATPQTATANRTERLTGQSAAAAITSPSVTQRTVPQTPATTPTTTPTTQPATDPAVGWEEREAQIRNRGIRGGQGFGSARTDSAPAPNDYAFLGNSGLGQFNRELLMAKDRVRAERNAAATGLKQMEAESQLQSDIFKERMAGERNQMALDREDARQAAIGEREQARLDFDRDKEMDAQTRRLFETETDGQKGFDSEGFTELKDYMTASGERDPYKAQQSFREEALAAARSYQTPENLLQAIQNERDVVKRKKMERVYSIAYGAVPTK